MKGIILAGGRGTRFYPVTKSVSKHLLPIYDKPLIYYPLSVLMLSGIREILIITNKEDLCGFQNLFGDGKGLGISISYAVQEQPRGVADGLLIGDEFASGDDVCLILGDNFFYGPNLTRIIQGAIDGNRGAYIFGFHVKDAENFGVAVVDEDKKLISIEEKPKAPASDIAVPGLYIYDNRVFSIAKGLTPSNRGELEISDVNKKYLEMGEIDIHIMGRGMIRLDTGNADGILEASEFVKTIQSMHGQYVGCIEEIAWRRGYITKEELTELGREYKNTKYGQYILNIRD